MATGREILILYNYFLFASDMRARFIRDEPPSWWTATGSALVEKVIMTGLYHRAWLGGLYTVVEGWKDELHLDRPTVWEPAAYADVLSFHQATINKLLDSRTGSKTQVRDQQVDETFEILLRRARNKAFHYEAAYVPEALERFEQEAEAPPRRWPQQLHDRFSVFFTTWFAAHQPA